MRRTRRCCPVPQRKSIAPRKPSPDRACKCCATAGRGGVPQPLCGRCSCPLPRGARRREVRSGSAPVYANTTAAEYPDRRSRRPADLLANQLAQPVAFVEEIRAMAASGVRTFVEVGPGVVLTRLDEAILTEAGFSECEFFALDAVWGKTVRCARLGECSDAFAGSRSSS